MSNSGKKLAFWGTILQLGFLIGLSGTVVGMLREFADPQKSSEAQREALATSMNLSMYLTAGGILVSFIGAIFLLIALFGSKYRASWFKNVMWVLSILWLFSIPVGTILGAVVIIYLSKHKDDFSGSADRLPSGSPDSQ